MQGSSYTVQQLTHTEGAKKTIFAVNFLLSEQAVFAPFRLRVKNPAGMQALFATAEREWVKKGAGCGDVDILIDGFEVTEKSIGVGQHPVKRGARDVAAGVDGVAQSRGLAGF